MTFERISANIEIAVEGGHLLWLQTMKSGRVMWRLIATDSNSILARGIDVSRSSAIESTHTAIHNERIKTRFPLTIAPRETRFTAHRSFTWNTDTQLTILSDRHAAVSTTLTPYGGYWGSPSTADVRKWVDPILKEQGYRRVGRVTVDIPDSTRYLSVYRYQLERI